MFLLEGCRNKVAREVKCREKVDSTFLEVRDGRACVLILLSGFFFFVIIFLKDFVYLFFREGEERERDINVWLPIACPLLGKWLTTQACALTGN